MIAPGSSLGEEYTTVTGEHTVVVVVAVVNRTYGTKTFKFSFF